MNPNLNDINSIEIQTLSNVLTNSQPQEVTVGETATNTVRKVVNLMLTHLDTSSDAVAGVTIDLYTGSSLTSNIATEIQLYKGNTICVVDTTCPIILTEGMTLKARCVSGSSVNFYCAAEVYSPNV